MRLPGRTRAVPAEFPRQACAALGLPALARRKKEMTRGLGEPRVKARLAREGSRRGVLRAGRKENAATEQFQGESKKEAAL